MSDVGHYPHLVVTIGNIIMKNPVMPASGTFGYGEEYAPLFDLNRLGAIVVKGTSLVPWKGNPPPRAVEVPAGMLCSIGLQNVGVDNFIEEKLPFLSKFDTPVIVNLAAESLDEFVELARRLDQVQGVAGLELNISCPNVKKGGMAFGINPRATAETVEQVRKVTKLTVIVKLTPNVTDITESAKSAEGAGADALSLINGLLGMAIDVEARRPRLGNITGGLTGPAIRPIAVRMVWEVARAVNIPVIGIGGIVTADDALEFFIAGATAVQVGTATLINPRATIEIIEGIENYLVKNDIKDINQLVGSLKI